MKRIAPDKMLLLQKAKRGSRKESESSKKKKNRLLITVTVLGSAGPMRFLVKEDDPVSMVIDAALKSYAREGRLPILGSNAAHFFLYCNSDFEAMSPVEAIGSRGGRTFVLCRKVTDPPDTQQKSEKMARNSTRSGGSWKAWLKKSFSGFKSPSN